LLLSRFQVFAVHSAIGVIARFGLVGGAMVRVCVGWLPGRVVLNGVWHMAFM